MQYKQIVLIKNKWNTEYSAKVESEEWKKDYREKIRSNGLKQ
jgi:hypothetical protein